jgi:chromosome segregation ATPase
MANFKLSQLQELRNITEDQAQESYVMVVANDDTGKLKNYRIKISELSKFAETGGFVQETITPEEVAQMINKAIKDHEIINAGGETIVIPEKIVEVDTIVKEVTLEVENLKDTTTEVVKETLNIKSTVDDIETTSTQAYNKANSAITKVEKIEDVVVENKSKVEEAVSKVETVESEVTEVKSTLNETASKVDTVESEVTEVKSTLDETTSKVETVESEVTEVKSTLDETASKVETVESEVTEVKTVIIETTTKVENNEIAINNITQEIEILKTIQPKIDAVTEEHVEEIFNECFCK